MSEFEFVNELNGYTVGQLVDVRIVDGSTEDGPSAWQRARIAGLDRADGALPYAIKFGNEVPGGPYDRDDWVRPENIRAAGAAQATRWEFRTRPDTYSTWRDWAPVVAGWVSRIGADDIEFREAPTRTDAEILAKAREVAESGADAGSIVLILRGEF